jgi:hypothetical protein
MTSVTRPVGCVEVRTRTGYDERSGMGKVEVSNDELRTVRDAMRELNRLVDALEHGDAEKFVLCQNNRMRAVVISLETFTKLSSASGRADLKDVA